MTPENIEQLEIDLLLEALFQRYGYDFRSYSRASVDRVIRSYVRRTHRKSPSTLIPEILHNRELFDVFVREFSVTVSTMFRDPQVFRQLNQEVFPWLRTHPFFRIWHAGCAAGEEVYSLAILLQEAGLYDRATIFATDFNDHALQTAARGVYDVSRVKEFEKNYREAGGQSSLATYYRTSAEHIVLDRRLRDRITFANHNLVVDEVFSEVHLVLCRNVLIYFGEDLRDRAVRLFKESLVRGGFLCLGQCERVREPHTTAFRRLTPQYAVYARTDYEVNPPP